jgi:hypothetical protein
MRLHLLVIMQVAVIISRMFYVFFFFFGGGVENPIHENSDTSMPQAGSEHTIRLEQSKTIRVLHRPLTGTGRSS